MKLLMEPIEVEAPDGAPMRFRWRGRWYAVREVSQEWVYRGRWWTDVDLHGEQRRYFRVIAERLPESTRVGGWRSRGGPSPQPEATFLAASGFEIFEREEQWVLSRLLD